MLPPATSRFGLLCSPFTWTNLQFDNNFIQERLDIAIATSSWLSEFPKSHVTHQPPLGLLILIRSSYSELSFAKPFRFTCFWADDIQFNDVLGKAWSVHHSHRGSPTFFLSSKLSGVKSTFKAWDKFRFGLSEGNLSKVNVDLGTIFSNPSQSNFRSYKCFDNQLKSFPRLQDYSKQRSRGDKIRVRDANTRYFFTLLLVSI